MVAGTADVDHPAQAAALSVLPLGSDVALTSRVRRVGGSHLFISAPRDAHGIPAVLVAGDLIELSWQADDGLRSVQAELLARTEDSLWAVQVRGRVSRIQRRDAVRAPIGLPVSVAWNGMELTGSTIDLSEGGLLCVLRPQDDRGLGGPHPRKGQRLTLWLDLYSDVLRTEVELIGRRSRGDRLQEWSLEFTGLPEAAADLIRSHVFTALRNARARDLSRIY